MLTDSVALVKYSKKEDRLNCLTHAAGAAAAAVVLAVCLASSVAAGDRYKIFSAAVYGASMIVLYTASAVYHGLPEGPAKKRARMVDYSMIFVLIAGTATPCALIGLYGKSPSLCRFVFLTAWGCAVVGIASTVLFFQKTRVLRIVMYIAEGVVMFSSVFPILDEIDKSALGILLLGGLVYILGMLFLRWGQKRQYAHNVFHIFVLAGSAIHFYAINEYMFT